MKTRPRHLIAALAALAGLSAPSPTVLPFHAAPLATVTASAAALKHESKPRRRAGAFFNFTPPRDRGGCFKHFTLNQRQRRKFNRQRHAAGDKTAFA